MKKSHHSTSFEKQVKSTSEINIDNQQFNLEMKYKTDTYLNLENNFNCIVADDEIFTRKSTIKVLQRIAKKMNFGINLIEAEDGIECIYKFYEAIKKGIKINAIISDEMMVNMNGTLAAEILFKIKNLNLETVRFYLLTAYPDVQSQYVNKIYSKPLNDFVAKKILLNEL
jgi:response regulator RpfG family c-di-GMP phosphodiesterase